MSYMYYKRVLYLTRWKKSDISCKMKQKRMITDWTNATIFVWKVVVTANVMYCTNVTELASYIQSPDNKDSNSETKPPHRSDYDCPWGKRWIQWIRYSRKNSNNRQQPGRQEKTTIICNKVATKIIKKHTHKPRKIAHTLCSGDINSKIRGCAHDKYLLENVLTMILDCIIHQPLLNTSEAFISPWTIDDYNFFVSYFAGDMLVQYETDK